MSFDMHKLSLSIAETTYEVPAIVLTDEQVRHMVAYAARVKIERAAAGKAADQSKAHEARTARIATVYDIDGTQRRSPVETEHLNLLRAWLRDKGEKAETLKAATNATSLTGLAMKHLPDDATKGTSLERADKLAAIMLAKAEEIVASRSMVDADV